MTSRVCPLADRAPAPAAGSGSRSTDASGTLQTTGDIQFDATSLASLNQTAADIQTALALIVPGTICQFLPSSASGPYSAPYNFRVTFPTSVSTFLRPVITLLAPTGAGHATLNTTFQATFLPDASARLQVESADNGGEGDGPAPRRRQRRDVHPT